MGYKFSSISTERKKYIDNLAENLTKTLESSVSLESMAQAFGITFPDLDCMAYFAKQKGNEFYIYSPKHSIPCVRRYGRAHELGHILLGHLSSTKHKDEREVEADYFVTRLGMNQPHTIFITLETMWAFWRNRYQIVKYIKNTDKETRNKVIKDRTALERLLTDEEFYKK